MHESQLIEGIKIKQAMSFQDEEDHESADYVSRHVSFYIDSDSAYLKFRPKRKYAVPRGRLGWPYDYDSRRIGLGWDYKAAEDAMTMVTVTKELQSPDCGVCAKKTPRPCPDHKQARHQLDCAICTQELKVGFTVAKTPCPCKRSYFHLICIQDWLVRNPSCPLCRCKISLRYKEKPIR